MSDVNALHKFKHAAANPSATTTLGVINIQRPIVVKDNGPAWRFIIPTAAFTAAGLSLAPNLSEPAVAVPITLEYPREGMCMASPAFEQDGVPTQPRTLNDLLARRPAIKDMLTLAKAKLLNLFGTFHSVRVEYSCEVPDSPDEEWVTLWVDTRLPYEQARDLKQRFDDEWWIDVVHEVPELRVILHFV